MQKLNIFQAIKIGTGVIRAVKQAQEEIKAAKGEGTPGGEKVTPAEVVSAIVKALLGITPDVYEVVTGEKIPADTDPSALVADL